MNAPHLLDFSFGKRFPPNMVFMGYALMGIGLMALFFGAWLISLIILFFGAWMALSKSGVQLNLQNKTYRAYTVYLFKKGKWQSLEDYPDMAFLRGREGYTAYSRAQVPLHLTEEVWDIYLLSANHRRRLILKRCYSQAQAEEEGRTLAEKLGLRWTAFNPERSQRTMRIRR